MQTHGTFIGTMSAAATAHGGLVTVTNPIPSDRMPFVTVTIAHAQRRQETSFVETKATFGKRNPLDQRKGLRVFLT